MGPARSEGFYGVIWVPDFHLQAMLRHEPELWRRPVAVVDPEEGEGRVMGMTSPAWTAGVRLGQTPTQALARCGGLQIRPRQCEQEAIAQNILLSCANARSAFIEDTAEGICTMEVTGASAFEQNAAGAARGLLDALSGMALRGRFGLAPTPDLALCAARATRDAHPVLIAGPEDDFLSGLPIDALGPDASMAAILVGWGIRTAREFVALGRLAVAERLGMAGTRLWDRAAGESRRPLRLVRPREEFFESHELEFEVAELGPLQFRLRRMLEQVVRRLAETHRAAGALRLELGFSDGACHRADLPAPEPTLNQEALFGLLQNHLERLRAPAGVVALRLSVDPAMADVRQRDIFENGLRDPARFAETVSRIVGWIGPQRIGYAVMRDSHRPDDFVLDSPGLPPAMDGGASAMAESAVGLTLRRFRPPRAADVRVRDGRPVFVRAQQAGAGRVRAARGPWTLSGEWWDRGGWQREEWDVEVDGAGILRIFKESESWFIDGAYD